MRVIPPGLPAGAVRRYGWRADDVPVPSDRPTTISRGRSTLVCAPSWIAGYHGDRLVGVVRESALSADVAATSAVVFGFREGSGSVLVRWDLASGAFEPLARVSYVIGRVACSDDATRIVTIDDEHVVRIYDGNGTGQWERTLEAPRDDDDDELRLGGLESVSFGDTPDAVTLYFHLDDRDLEIERFTRVHVTHDAPLHRDHRDERPAWWPSTIGRRRLHGAVALGQLAIAYDGSRIATARAAWARPDATPLEVPEIYDSSAASSWGGEASVLSLTFGPDNELRRVEARNYPYMLHRCFAKTATALTTYEVPLPWTDRHVVQRDDGTIAIGDRTLTTTASREARIAVAFDGSAIAIVDGPYGKLQASIYDGDGRLRHTMNVPSGGLAVIGPRGAAMACHHAGGFTIVQVPTGEAQLVLADTRPAFSPDGAAIAFGRDWRLFVMNPATHELRASNDLASPITGLCYGRDGALFTEHADATVIEWSTELECLPTR